MTWLKLDETFDDECAQVGLSDAAFRTHVQGLLYAMRRLTDGWIDDRTASRAPDTDDPELAVKELCAVGFWRREPGGYRIIHHIEWQPTRADVEAKKQADAARQAKARGKRAQQARDRAVEDAVTRDVTRDKRRDDTRDSPHHRQTVTTGRSGSVRSEGSQQPNPALEEKGRVPGWDACPACGSFDPCDCEV